MKLMVTKADIAKSTRIRARADGGDYTGSVSCPIAQAARRVSNRKRVWVVGPGLGSFVEIGNKFYTLPKAAIKFIAAWDEGHRVKPISFMLRAVVPNKESEK